MREQGAVVEVDDVHKQFRGHNGAIVQALDGVSLRVERGSSLAVIGESGSGKTTLARILVGLERHDSGRVVIAGREFGRSKMRSAARLDRAGESQMVFQNPYASLDPRQTIGGGLEEILRRHLPDADREVRASRASEVLQRVGLSERHAGLRPSSLSGGERQRVAIARALICEPALLILDEPVSALDVLMQAQILNLLRTLRERDDVTMLLITHDLGIVRHVAEDAVVMRRGQIVERGTASKVLDRPEHPYTQLLKASIPGPGWTPDRSNSIPRRKD